MNRGWVRSQQESAQASRCLDGLAWLHKSLKRKAAKAEPSWVKPNRGNTKSQPQCHGGTKVRRKACESGWCLCDSRRKVPTVGHLGGERRSHALFPHMLMNQCDEITCSCDLLRVGSNDLEFFFLSFELITNNLDLDFASVMSFDLDFASVVLWPRLCVSLSLT